MLNLFRSLHIVNINKNSVKIIFFRARGIIKEFMSPRLVVAFLNYFTTQQLENSERYQKETHNAREFISPVTLLCWSRKVVRRLCKTMSAVCRPFVSH